jgi:SSS family solute:Na+ symporter/sodium/proline symporter
VHDYFPAGIKERDAIFPALAASLVALVVVSFVTPKPSAEQLAQFAE